jgi:hypothetical protein
MACLCCDAVGEGLRAVTMGADTRRPFQAARRALSIVRQLTTRWAPCDHGPVSVCMHRWARSW